jgi:hypothetical protein
VEERRNEMASSSQFISHPRSVMEHMSKFR